MRHHIDFQCRHGPLGGQVGSPSNRARAPGETRRASFKAPQSRPRVYHCANAMQRPPRPHLQRHATHVSWSRAAAASADGLQHELLLMQGEIYTERPSANEGEADRRRATTADRRSPRNTSFSEHGASRRALRATKP